MFARAGVLVLEDEGGGGAAGSIPSIFSSLRSNARTIVRTRTCLLAPLCTQKDPRDTEEERYFGIGGPQRPQEPKYSRHDLYMAYLERKRNREETEDPRGESSKTPRWYIPDLE